MAKSARIFLILTTIKDYFFLAENSRINAFENVSRSMKLTTGALKALFDTKHHIQEVFTDFEKNRTLVSIHRAPIFELVKNWL